MDEKSIIEIRHVAKEIARRLRVDGYDHAECPGLEPGDLYLQEQKRDVGLYVFEHGNPRKDQRIGTFVGTKRALFHFELNAEFLPMADLLSPAKLGLTMQYRNDHTFFRAVTIEQVPGIVAAVCAAVWAGLIREKT